jgi:hypothetical protein
MDVDLWMRHYATQSFLGNWDTYGVGRPKNMRLYIRPSDGKIIPLDWDADLGNLTDPLIYHGAMSRLDEICDLPANLRLFWGHMLDLVNRSFNAEYIAPWATHYGSLTGENYNGEVSQIAIRATSATAQIKNAIPEVSFQITINGGDDLTVGGNTVTISGDGWVDVRTIRVNGNSGDTVQLMRPTDPLRSSCLCVVGPS